MIISTDIDATPPWRSRELLHKKGPPPYRKKGRTFQQRCRISYQRHWWFSETGAQF